MKYFSGFVENLFYGVSFGLGVVTVFMLVALVERIVK